MKPYHLGWTSYDGVKHIKRIEDEIKISQWVLNLLIHGATDIFIQEVK